MIEGIDDEQQRLVMVDFERLVDGPLQFDWETLHFRRFNSVRDLAVGTEQSAAIHLATVGAAHLSEFDREPEKARHGSNDAGEAMHSRLPAADSGDELGGCMRALTETHQRFREKLVGVHGYVSGDVVKDIGLWQIIQLVGAADCDG